MKILFIADKVPYPIYKDGGTLMNFHILNFFNKNHNVDFIAFGKDKFPDDFMRDICTTNILVNDNIKLTKFHMLLSLIRQNPPFYNNRSDVFLDKIKDLMDNNKYDLIFIDSIYMDVYGSEIKHHNKIISLHDSLSLLYLSFYKKSNKIFSKIYYKYCSYVYKKKELYILSNYKKCFFVSPNDIAHLKGKSSFLINNSYVIPNGVNQQLIDKPLNIRRYKHTIVFTGVMDYKPNVDAVLFFADKILPLILIKNPKVTFFIVGKNPTKKIQDLKSSNIIVTGFVDDISDYILNSTVYVSPLISGAGLKNKILEAMALRTPIVSTSISLDGINVENDIHILCKDNPRDFAESVCLLLDNEKLRDELATNAYELILNKYSWKYIYSLYNKVLFN